MNLSRWIRKKLHVCKPPHQTPDNIQFVFWTCTECGQTWVYQTRHIEERVYMGGADADIGGDETGWWPA